jgi:NADPH:quinone reductase-like Zn-dependent oxidoreductase
LPFPLQTAVAALHMYLGMELPGERPADAPAQKVLVWGAGGAVGGYAVQYAKSAGYTVIATASPRAAAHLESIGASAVLDYKSPTIVSELRDRGPYAFLFTASGDPASQKAIALIMQPEGGKFASTLAGDVELPSNVERVYDSFTDISQKGGPEFEKFRRWWYGEYLEKAIRQHTVQPALVERRSGGLNAIMGATDDVLAGRVKAKLVLNPQE